MNPHYLKNPMFLMSHLHLMCLTSLQNPMCLKNLRYRLFRLSL